MVNYIIPRERPATLAPVYWNSLLQTHARVEYFYGRKLPVEYNAFCNGKMNVLVPKKDWNFFASHIVKTVLHNPTSFRKIQLGVDRAERKILRFLKRSNQQSTFQKLLKEAFSIQSLFFEYDSASVPIWFFAGDLLRENVRKKLGISSEELALLSIPDDMTFSSQMEYDLLSLALTKIPSERIGKILEKRYWWIPFGYEGTLIWDANYFSERVNTLRKNQNRTKIDLDMMKQNKRKLALEKRRLKKKRVLHNDEKYFVSLLQNMTQWTDRRKMLEYPLFYRYDQLLRQIEKLYSFPLGSLNFILTEELSLVPKHRLKILSLSEWRRAHAFVTVAKNGKAKIASEKVSQDIFSAIRSRSTRSTLKGIVASGGIGGSLTGKVRVLSSARECFKMKRGEWLVASMTTPEFILGMRRAFGFITDEGGVTCHAAIVAREMNKPCIIGTKNATKVLEDGMLISADMATGKIRILKDG